MRELLAPVSSELTSALAIMSSDLLKQQSAQGGRWNGRALLPMTTLPTVTSMLQTCSACTLHIS
eukprot:1304850-Amphidinium_carterae.1